MFPVICEIGPFKIFSYGLMLAVAALVCTFLLSKDAKAKGISREIIMDLMFWLVLAGIIGARLFYIVLNLSFFMDDPREIIMLQHGGLAWQGGLIAASLTGLWFVKKHRLPLPMMLDLCAPYIALGQSIGRIGCFLNGCCQGKPVAWGIYFPVHQDRLYPTQLYEAIGLFFIFLILKTFQKNNPVSGRIFVFYLMMAASLRFGNEFFRADHDVLYAGLSVFQWVAVGLFLVGVVILFKLKKTN